jgi:hypothetical protein
MAVPISSLLGGSGAITTYTQTGVLSTSQTVAIPAGISAKLTTDISLR